MGAFMKLTSLRTRTLIVTLIMLIGLVGFLQFLTYTIIGHGFQVVEERIVQEHVQQAANALNDSIASLDRTTNDYAMWDATYAFVAEPDLAYVNDNFAPTTFINNNLSYVAVVNTVDEVVYARAIDASGQEVPPPTELAHFTGANARLLQHGDPNGHLGGLIILADGPMLLAARPILTNQGAGPARGTLLMGRRLDAREIARLAAIIRMPLTVRRLDDPSQPPVEQQAALASTAEQPNSVIPLDDQRISGSTRIADIFGQPGVLIQIELPRDVAQLGQEVTRQYALVLLGLGLLFGVLVFWLIERVVLARIITLNAQVAAVDASHPNAQVTVTGRDEISQLGGAINQMLSGLAQAQQQLAENERHYRQMIELSPDPIIVHDGSHIRYTNTAGARLLGLGSATTANGQPVDATIAALVPSRDGTLLQVERSLLSPDGEAIEVELVVLLFRDQEREAIQVLVRNITARKQVEQALRTAKEAADAANRAKTQFLATMSHELRTPLTSIIGYADLLNGVFADTSNNEVRRHIERIRSAGAHLLAIINAVLDITRIEAGRMHVQAVPVTLAALLPLVTDSIQPLVERNGNRLEVYNRATVDTMETDEVHLRQILINLLGNACKFTHAGLITLTVTTIPAKAGDADSYVSFAVRDTGIGIHPEQVVRLFRDFVQVDASTTRKYGGTGLGLALSRRLANLLGGSLMVTSTPAVGSTFTLTVPRKLRVETTPALDGATTAQAPVVSTSEATLLATQPETRIILVIDHDPIFRTLLPQILAHPHLHIETAANGREGLTLAEMLLPDLIILDGHRRETDGWNVLHQLKVAPATRAIPVLMLTVDQDAERALGLGAAEVLPKPADPHQLAYAVAHVLQRQSARAEPIVDCRL